MDPVQYFKKHNFYSVLFPSRFTSLPPAADVSSPTPQSLPRPLALERHLTRLYVPVPDLEKKGGKGMAGVGRLLLR